jgi:hypothetical protein
VRRPSLLGAPSQATVPPRPVILTTNGMPRLYRERQTAAPSYPTANWRFGSRLCGSCLFPSRSAQERLGARQQRDLQNKARLIQSALWFD